MIKKELKNYMSIQHGLKSKKRIYRGSFAKYVEDEINSNDTETVCDWTKGMLAG